jgi:hypothetical protein
MAEASQRMRTLIRIRSATTAIKRGILRPRAGKSTLRRNRSLQRIAKASKQVEVPPSQQLQLMTVKEKSSLLQQVMEQYVYLDHDIISDDNKSILKVFTGQMHTVDITSVYQYAPVIDDVRYLEGIKSLEELKEKEYNKEMIGTNNEHVSKIYTAKRDDDDEYQEGVVSLAVYDKTMIHPTMEILVDKDM